MKRATYKSSGVNISQANQFVRGIKQDMKSTFTDAVLNRTGAFGSLFELNSSAFKNPVLVSSTDGVGTKLLLAKHLKKHDTVGIDLVAMNVNDILCMGAKPLFFLDYIACGKLNPKILTSVVKGIAEGCRQSGMALIGGETAEMPGMYRKDDYDLAGFAVGVVDKDKIIDGSQIQIGDRLIGLPSSGFHSNGYSLVRKVFSSAEQKKFGRELLEPTRIYAQEVRVILEKFEVKAIAHITGGAYYEKLTKVLAPGKCFKIDTSAWEVPKIFHIVQKKGKIATSEMFRTFNMGIGLVIVVGPGIVSGLEAFLTAQRIGYYVIGEVISDSKKKIVIT